jgi:hypothetical protein
MAIASPPQSACSIFSAFNFEISFFSSSKISMHFILSANEKLSGSGHTFRWSELLEPFILNARGWLPSSCAKKNQYLRCDHSPFLVTL